MIGLWIQRLVVVLLGALILGAPLVIPPILSRRGYLSIGRWLIFAAATLFAVVFLAAMSAEAFRRDAESRPAMAMAVGTVPLISGFFGCLVAAAISPKEPAA